MVGRLGGVGGIGLLKSIQTAAIEIAIPNVSESLDHLPLHSNLDNTNTYKFRLYTG